MYELLKNLLYLYNTLGEYTQLYGVFVENYTDYSLKA